MSGRATRSPGGGLRTGSASFTVAAAAAVLALGLAAAKGLERVPRAASPSAPAAPATSDPGRLAGRWRSRADGSWLIVTAKGEVWSDSGRMQGRLIPGTDRSTVVFGDGRFACGYSVTFRDDRTADWHLLDGTPGAPCPRGLFVRPL